MTDQPDHRFHDVAIDVDPDSTVVFHGVHIECFVPRLRLTQAQGGTRSVRRVHLTISVGNPEPTVSGVGRIDDGFPLYRPIRFYHRLLSDLETTNPGLTAQIVAAHPFFEQWVAAEGPAGTDDLT